METQFINNNGHNYLSDFLDDLPDNVFFNKVTTSCGMTSLALSNNVKYVICVPFKNLIINKVKWCNERDIDVLGVYDIKESKVTDEMIQEFKGNKIMVTWDSLPKVVKNLPDIGDYKLLIDEAHQLINSGAFRTTAIEHVLQNFRLFKSFVFGTATPIREKYQLPILRDIPKVEIIWDNLEIVNIHYVKIDNSIDELIVNLCLQYLNGDTINNAHIFLNSVKELMTIIESINKLTRISSKSVRIVCANTERNREVVERSKKVNITISSINSEPCKINFYTSTAFEGTDIYDENGKTYIISNGNKDYTKIDIITTLPQIIGRIRNAKIKNFVELWYSPNRYYSYTTEEQFEKIVKENLNKAETIIRDYNLVSDETKKSIIKGVEENPYILYNVITNILKVNETVWYYEMNSFQTLRTAYYVNNKTIPDKKTVKINQIEYTYTPIEKIEITNPIKVRSVKPTFKNLCLQFFDAYETKNKDVLNKINNINPVIKQAFNILGIQKIKALEFREKDIKKALLVLDNLKSKNLKIVKLLNLKTGTWVSTSELKLKLQSIYVKLNIEKTAKATDIIDYYEVKSLTKRKDSQVQSGFVINMSKYK